MRLVSSQLRFQGAGGWRIVNRLDISGWPTLSDFILCKGWAILCFALLAEEIGENPCCSGNREGLDGFAPIRMTAGIRKKQRYPHE